ncbi:P-loop NTPase fold protein [Pseudomonas sp. TE3610]
MLSRCREGLVELIADPQNKVIALSGKWGTGKTHMWRNICENTQDKQVQESISISLFGVSSISELKLRVVQAIAPTLKENSAAAARATTIVAGAKKLLRSFHSGFSALDELGLLVAPLFLKGRFIVIDDIERKHEKLAIDEVLGFIDECVQSHKCRMLLVLNSDKLNDKVIWEQFREKVIDQELRLETTPAEAFDIAVQYTSTAWADQLKPAIELCGITNIRVIRKIIGVSNRILGAWTQLPVVVLERVIPSTVLLSAIHFKALENGPGVDFVLKFSPTATLTRILIKQQKGEAASAEDNEQKAWCNLLHKLGIRDSDGYERLVVDFLTSGMMDSWAVQAIVQRYIDHDKTLIVRKRVQQFQLHYDWHSDLCLEDLIAELEALRPDVRHMDAYTVSQLAVRARQLTGNTEASTAMIQEWLEAFREDYKNGYRPQLDSEFPVHPAIIQEVSRLQALDDSHLSVLEVYKSLENSPGWSKKEERALRAATTEAYDEAIRAHQGEDLKTILLKGTNLLENRASLTEHFGETSDRFLEACRSIYHGEPDSRLADIIARVFSASTVKADLLRPLALKESEAQET